MFSWFKYIGIVLSIVLVLIIIVLLFGWYPVASVNGHMIFAVSHRSAASLAYNFYMYSSTSTNPAIESKLSTQIKKIALEGLMDQYFVDERIEKEMHSDELKQKVQEQVQIVFNDADAKEQLLRMTKGSERTILNYYLIPRIKYQILDGRLRLEQKNIVEWMLSERRKANVHLFLPGMRWTGEEIEIINN